MNTIVINGQTITTNGRNVTIINNKVLVDGKEISDLNKIAGKEINITIDGDVGKLEIDYCTKVQVNGNTQNVKTTSGDVDVTGDVNGSIQTMSGDVDCGNVGGNISTMNGDICHK